MKRSFLKLFSSFSNILHAGTEFSIENWIFFGNYGVIDIFGPTLNPGDYWGKPKTYKIID